MALTRRGARHQNPMAEQFWDQQAKPLSALIIGMGGSGAWTVVHVKKHLQDMYGENLPERLGLVVFDTAETNITQIGRVTLAPHEYIHVGGDAYGLVRQVAETDRYPHIKSWLLADRYLRELPRNLFNLDEGAGQFRQLGRLAFFRSVAQPANSAIAAVLDTKLTRLAQESDNTILVMLSGSLVGGTGAGMFLDVPHIIRRVAQRRNIKVTLRGFFYLPQAFLSDLDANALQSAHARAFGALRELQRFMLSEDYRYGYPMYYHAPNSGVDPELWRAKNQEKLYDFVYLLDGGGEMRMNARSLAQGSASVVADAIVSFIDPHFGEVNEQMMANLPAKIATRQGLVGKQALVSTLGAFSMLLPVPQIVEEWAYQLGREIVGKIVSGQHDEQGFIRAVKAEHDPTQPEKTPDEEVENILTNRISLQSPFEKEREIHPTALWEHIFNFYRRYTISKTKAVKELSTYPVRMWLNAVVPGQSGATPEFRAAVRETRQVIEDSVHEHVKTSDQQKPRRDPKEDWRNIQNRADRYIVSQLGPIDASGGRQGGRYRDALNRFVTLQEQRFREYLSAYLYHHLNGTSTEARDPIVAKTGKLAWVLTVLTQMHRTFATVIELLEAVRTSKDTHLSNMRQLVQSNLDTAVRDMQDKADARRRVPLGRHPAIEAQEAYLQHVENYVDFYRTEFARQALAHAVERLTAQLEQVIDELKRWATILGTDPHSLYNELLSGERIVQDERLHAEKTANHEVIHDAEWEQELFQKYVTDEQRSAMFRAWQWEIHLDGDKIDVACRFGDPEQDTELRKDMRGKWAESNRQSVIAYVQQVFAHALQRETVLGYLMNRYTDRTADLADMLARRSGHLLTMYENPLTQGRVLTNILLARHAVDNPDETRFLGNVLNELGAQKGLGDIRDQDYSTLRYLQCANPYRLTVLSTVELIGLQGIAAYDECRERYNSAPYDTRQTLHIFPAEVRAVPYEQNITQLQQPPRLFADRVVLLLENEDRFLDFLFLLAHGIVHKQEISQGARTQFHWVLSAPDPKTSKKDVFKDWWLTMPTDNEPSLLEAMITYVLLEEDIRGLQPTPLLKDPIPYGHILKYLDQARYEDTLERVEWDQLAIEGVDTSGKAILDDELRTWVKAFMPPFDPDTGEGILEGWDQIAFLGNDPSETHASNRQIGVAELVVRHDIARELREEFAAALPALLEQVKAMEGQVNTGKAHDELRLRQEDYDLHTISILALNKEMENLRQVIRKRYETKIGANRRL